MAQRKNPAGGLEEVKPVNTIEQLSIRLGELADQSKVIENTADAEKRSLNAEETAKMEELQRMFGEVESEIHIRSARLDMENRFNALTQPNQRISPPDDLETDAPKRRPAHSITGGLRSGTSKGTFGFVSLGEFAMSAFAMKSGKVDPRIMNAPTSFGSEGVNQDGGFAVPPDFRNEIMKQIQSEESLIGLTDQQTTSGNSLTLPLDTTTPWQTSGGIIPAWVGEGGAIAQSKPLLGQLETKLHKLAALVPITDELMQDVTSLTQWLNSKVPEKFTSFLNDVIVNGNGVAKPIGMLNAGSKITVAAVSGQGAGTIVAKNLADMWARLYGPFRRDAYWLMNQDIEPQLQVMVMPGTTPAYPVYLPPGGFAGAPYSTIFGRPCLPLEACQTVGTEGDLILCVPRQYLTVMKSDGFRADVSIHLYFDTDHTAFRFVMRVGGQSYWPAAVARAHGSNTLSPIVTLNSTRT
jgi:HK97 family phage major capsid protein